MLLIGRKESNQAKQNNFIYLGFAHSYLQYFKAIQSLYHMSRLMLYLKNYVTNY